MRRAGRGSRLRRRSGRGPRPRRRVALLLPLVRRRMMSEGGVMLLSPFVLFCTTLLSVYIFVDFDIQIGKMRFGWTILLVLLQLSRFSMSRFHSAHALPLPTIWVRSGIPLPRSYVARSCGGCHTWAHHDSSAHNDTTGAWAREPGTNSGKRLRAAEDLRTVPRGR